MLIILLAAFGTASCGVLHLRPVPRIPTTPADRPYPKRAMHARFVSLYAYECLEGYYTGGKATGKGTGGKDWQVRTGIDISKTSRPNPDGRGKIFEFYLTQEVKTPPPLSAGINDPWGSEEWGYSFTFYTTDDDTVTDCKVTKRLLHRW
jgi:hypothetical protein